MTPQEDERLRHITRQSVPAFLVGGLVVSTLAGLAARQALITQGVEIVGWPRALQLFIPLALWFEISYLLLALLTRWSVHRSVRADPHRLPGLEWRMFGAFLGMAGVLGYSLFDLTSYGGPGGFAEAVIMWMVLSPLTIPFMTAIGAVGALAGFVVVSGLLTWKNRHRPHLD